MIAYTISIIFNIIKNFHLLENFSGKSKTEKKVENIISDATKESDVVPVIPASYDELRQMNTIKNPKKSKREPVQEDLLICLNVKPMFVLSALDLPSIK